MKKRRMKNEKKKYTMSDSRWKTCCAVRAGTAMGMRIATEAGQ